MTCRRSVTGTVTVRPATETPEPAAATVRSDARPDRLVTDPVTSTAAVAPSADNAAASTNTSLAVGGASGAVADTVTVRMPDAASPLELRTVYLIGKTPSASGAVTTTAASMISASMPSGTTSAGSAKLNGMFPPGSDAAPNASTPTVRPGRTTTSRSGATGGSATAGGATTATRTEPLACLPYGSVTR